MPRLSWTEVRNRAIKFKREWSGASSERSDKQTFYNEFFDVFGIRRASVASFEENVRNLQGNVGAIDLLWRGKLLVEHKSRGADLSVAASEAFGYIEDLTREGRHDEVPRFVLVSDFAHFVLYDLEPDEQLELPLFAGLRYESHRFALTDFPSNLRAFSFMLGQTRVRLNPEDPANEKAYSRMCDLHDSLAVGGLSGHDLERLLCRVLFCLFAEDTGIFAPDAFTQFIRTETRTDGSDLGARLNELFDWLNRPQADESFPDTDWRYGFRYVNGGLFADRLGFPAFTKTMRDALLFCCDFEWSRISPAVFGSLFQGVIDDRSRRQQGAHYTSERDIMKVIRSLFLDKLREEWERRKADRSTRRETSIEAFHQSLRDLQFLDPACGCGNFLVLAYRELRLLEVEVIKELARLSGGQTRMPSVNVDQFHGIERFEWPVRIAEVAMWLIDHQLNKDASDVFGTAFERLPLKTSPHIVCDNALRLDWNTVLPNRKCSYVFGNPPFVGKQFRNAEQKQDMQIVWRSTTGANVLDYVTCWYAKAADYIQGTDISGAFVSTNSITQGEQVGILWGALLTQWHIKIHFAHRTFAWVSEARGRAHVHVVIIGFAAFDKSEKRITDYDSPTGQPSDFTVSNISPYLFEGSDLVVTKRTTPISTAPQLSFGSMPNDGGHLLLSEEEKRELVQSDPQCAPYIRAFIGPDEFLYDTPRWCLWLVGASAAILRACPRVMERVEAVRAKRLESTRGTTRDLAATPTLFGENRQPTSRYLAIPKTSSELRAYIPMAFVQPDIVAGTDIFTSPASGIYHFGVLSSAIHTAWVETVAGRMKSDYRYSAQLVYNNYPWPDPTPEQRARVEEKAQAVLDARAPHLPPLGMNALADIYDPLTMPLDLHKAHVELDRAVELCYRKDPFRTNRERVEFLFRCYEQLTAPLMPVSPQVVSGGANHSRRSPRPRRPRAPQLRSLAQ